jgi:hypothetical protein
MFLEPLSFLGRLNSGVAIIFEILNILSILFNKLKKLGVSADLKLLYIC